MTNTSGTATTGPAQAVSARKLFFAGDQEYHYMTLRVMGDIPAGGAEAGEVLSIISRIPEGDDEQWFSEWNKAAVRVEKMGSSLENRMSRGYALLRAHSYYRTAEYFLSPSDPRRLPTFRKSQDTFYHAIELLGVRYKTITVPYGSHQLHAIYYSPENVDPVKPLILTTGGFDSTLEEQYFFFVRAILERGYSCLSFEGPGQGSVIREQGLPFTHEWEKPTKGVLDAFLKLYERPGKIVMFGSSLGGYLAPRAAAFDSRIDGVVAFDVMFDFGESFRRKIPHFVQVLIDKGFRGIARTLIRLKMRTNTTVRWGIHNAQWTLGVDDPVDVANAMSKFNIRDVAGQIHCPVLLLRGEKDHLVPAGQMERMKSSLVNAKSITTRTFTVKEGGQEHCQMGAFSLAHGEIFDWIEKNIK